MTTERAPNSFILDPVAMGIDNKIGPGSVVQGPYRTGGGLLVQGTFNGELIVAGGPLVVLEQGKVQGSIEVEGDTYVFGVIGAPGDQTTLTVKGELHLTSKCVVHGHIRFGKLAVYEGATVRGQMESLESVAEAPLEMALGNQ
jgi:cytoskeletal protein CcmA (bactofilin family)